MLADVEIRSLSPVFVGRTGEFAVLRAALARAAAGEPQSLLLAGEAGVGKTRLVEEFGAEARRAGAVVAVGGCVEIGADGLPFAPFSTALRALRGLLPDEVAAAAAGREEELARLLPELGEPGSAPPRGSRHDEEAMARLFELTVRLLERIAAERTVVLVVEDLHWADASTRHLLAYLFRALRGGRLVVIATYRADDVHRRHPLRPLLAELDRLRTVERIELPRFTRAEVRRQVTGMLASEPDEALVDMVFERSDGNAFFVEELVCARDEDGPGTLPDSLRDLLLVRVEALPEQAQRVTRIVAEGGSTVEYELLAEVARLAEDDLLEALRAAVGENLLLASADGAGYRFRHSLVREAVSDDLLPGERSRLNRRYAEALEADPGLVRAGERATRLASYWYAAHDAAKALPAVLHASVEARRRHAYAEQLRLLERAMELWEDVPDEVHARLRPSEFTEGFRPPLSPRGGHGAAAEAESDGASGPLRFLDLLAEAVVAGRLCGERETALKITKRALRLLGDDGDDGDALRSAWFWTQRSRLVSTLGRGDGREELAHAEDLMRGLPPSVVHADVLTHLASWHSLHEPGPEAIAAAERAVQYARMVAAEDIELNARLTRAGLLVEAGSVEPGLAEMYEVRQQAVERGMIADLARVHINLPSALEGVGRSADAVRTATEGIAFCREFGLLDTEGWVWANLAESQISLGRWEEALTAVEQVRRSALSAKPRGSAAERVARLALYRGDLATAGRQLAAAHEQYGTYDPQPQYELPLLTIELGIAAREGRILDLRAGLRELAAAGLPPGTQRYGWPLVLTATTAEADARGLPAAESGRAEALETLRTVRKTLATPVPVWSAHDQWVRAELARAENADTPEHWAEVLAAFEALDRPFDLAQVRHRAAEALLAARPDDTARTHAAELLRQARATAEDLAARPLAEDIALLAQRARIPLTEPDPGGRQRATGGAGPADPAGDLGLTSRERDVLRLVALGRSNRLIAEELFISPKTASVHVSNILAKLGVSARGEAAALAHRLRLFPPGA
ncbi:AAA family ATPase [Streptomyces sp. LHD-70]|uniref:helix-turn-helix transcriptional regulator n=1 Tax=Streptomyces sp. LHD-70 TaxID=3072140 RepID=UPI00280C8C13|nr:AAA family ATPase [Streptomyces sp. LHD-70]MDQ8701944.1 AAA family ATPase [Streptomyces sp. LHD-70]